MILIRIAMMALVVTGTMLSLALADNDWIYITLFAVHFVLLWIFIERNFKYE